MSVTATQPLLLPATRWSDDLLQQLDRYRWLLLGMVVVVYLAGFNGHWQMEPDSALYLALGRNLARGDGYTFRGQPHAMVLPGLPYALAGCFRLFGVHAMAAADGLMLLCGLAAVACTYRLIGLALGRPTAVVIAVGFAFSHEFHRYCYEIMTEAPFTASVTAFLAGNQAIFGQTKADPGRRARWWDWALLLGGLTVGLLVRPNMVPMLGIWLGLLLWRYLRRARMAVAVPLALALLALAVAWLVAFVRYEQGGHIANVYVQTLWAQMLHPVVWMKNAADHARDLFGQNAALSVFAFRFDQTWINAILGGVVLVCALALGRLEPLWGWWVLAMIATLILVQSHDRYLLAIGPLLTLGWWRLLRRVNAALPAKWGNLVFMVLFTMGTVVNVARVAELTLRQHRHSFYRVYKQGKFTSVIEVAASISRNIQPDDVIVTPNLDERIYSFLCDHPAYSRDEFRAMKLDDRRALVIVDPPNDDGKGLFAPGTTFLPYPEALKPVVRPGGKPPLWVYIAQPPG